ncbi:hypothetical protein OPQ81_011162 [Rhizoctonia solani]|nr:hypothetical protein OPQ81_011162 [Rhizoctonia solani]
MNMTSAGQPRLQGPILASQAPTISSTSLPLRQKFLSSRNFVVFPVQLGQKRSPLDAFPFTTYSITDIKTRHSCDPNLSQHIGEIWVETASYYKQKQNPQHEFIIFTVTTSGGLRNVIALNREVHVAGSSGLIGRHKSGTIAQDYFHISHYGEVDSLAKHCGRVTPNNRFIQIEQVDFESKAFSFSQLLVLASTINEREPSYKLSRNDRWFASLVWECILELMGSGIIRHGKYCDKRGQSKEPKVRRHYENFEEVLQKYRDDMVEFEKGLRDDIDVMGLDSGHSQKVPSVMSNRRGVGKTPAATTSASPTETHRPLRVAFSTAAPLRISHPSSIGTEKDRKSERTRVSSTCTSSNWTITSTSTDTFLSARMNKELPSLPVGVSGLQFSRPRARSTQGLIRSHTSNGSDSNARVRTFRNSLVMPTAYHGKEAAAPPPYSPLENWIDIGSEGYFGSSPAENRLEKFGTECNPRSIRSRSRIAQGHLKTSTRRA